MNISLAQIAPKLSKENEALHLKMVHVCEDESDLVVFPELSLNGYQLKDAVFEDAYTRSELEALSFLGGKCDVVFGCVYKEAHKIYNASIYASTDGLIHIHKKQQLPNYGLFQEARFFFPGHELGLLQTKQGKVALAICEELFDANIVADIAKANPDLVIVLSNSPARGFEEELLIEQTWESLLKACAIYSRAHVVFVNRVGFEDGLGFWGGSCVVTPDGHICHKAPLFEESLLHVRIEKKLSNISKYFLRHI